MTSVPPASIALHDFNIPHQVFYHTGSVDSLEQAAQERGQSTDQVIRSILFRLPDGIFVMVLVAGPGQISWPLLRAYLGQSRLTLATQQEVLDITGYRVGAVSPFGLPTPLRILADNNVFVPEVVSIGSGERGVAIILKSDALRSTLGNVEIGTFTVTE